MSKKDLNEVRTGIASSTTPIASLVGSTALQWTLYGRPRR